MIRTLNNKDEETAKMIRAVFQVSYAIEAELLKAREFPPLKRKIENFIKSDNSFYGYFVKDELAAVTEINHGEKSTHIQSLVVHPNFFRRGIAGSLVEFIFSKYNSELFTVETGLNNFPACELYRKYGFEKVNEYLTEIGIMKIRFKKEDRN